MSDAAILQFREKQRLAKEARERDELVAAIERMAKNIGMRTDEGKLGLAIAKIRGGR